jgi:predicted nuclease of predicted toxin-antitoxin system
MKCKLDENLGDLGRDLLTASGHDVSTVAMQGLSGSADDTLYQACRAEDRVLITLDRDFGEILRFAPEDTAGIAILDCRGQLSPTSILARIKELAALLEIESIDGQLWIVEPGRVRIHERREGQ